MKTIKELEARIKIIEPHKHTGTGYEEFKELKAIHKSLKDVLKLIDEKIKHSKGYQNVIRDVIVRELKELKAEIEG